MIRSEFRKNFSITEMIEFSPLGFLTKSMIHVKKECEVGGRLSWQARLITIYTQQGLPTLPFGQFTKFTKTEQNIRGVP